MKQQKEEKVGIAAYLALVFAIIFFSGIFAKSTGWTRILDFTVLSGKFGSIVTEPLARNFMGSGGSGARDGFIFGFSLLPAVMFALAVVNIVEHLGALEAARKMLTPVLKPLLGLPGTATLALVASLQSTDAGAGMTKLLFDNGEINDDQRSIFGAFQFSAGGTITNYFGTGAALFSLTTADKMDAVTVPMIIPLILIFVLKFVGANVMRLYLRYASKKANSKA